MKVKLFGIVGIVVTYVFITSCEDKVELPIPQGKFEHGVFIAHEGNFRKGNATISYYNPDSSLVTNNLFELVNKRTLGDLVQSLTKLDTCYYLVVSNSNKIEYTDQNFKSYGVIKDSIISPRYIISVNPAKAYISQWDTTLKGSIAVLDLSTRKVTKKITLGNGPEKMLIFNNKAYITNCGGMTNDSIISVVDVTTDKVVSTIKTSCNPKSLVLDKNNKIWVLCAGGFWQADYSLGKTGALQRIDPSTNTIETTIKFSSKYSQPTSLQINQAKDNLLYLYDGKVYEMPITSNVGVVKLQQSFYGLGVNPQNGDIYGANAGDYATNGWVIRYNKTYAKVDSFKVGIIPSEIAFY